MYAEQQYSHEIDSCLEFFFSYFLFCIVIPSVVVVVASVVVVVGSVISRMAISHFSSTIFCD